MRVRGWLIVGSPPWSWAGSLAPVSPVPQFHGQVPDAINFIPGTLIEWISAPGAAPTCLVLVEIPL